MNLTEPQTAGFESPPDAGGGSPSLADLNRPALDEACIAVRPDGRQLVISQGKDPDDGDREFGDPDAGGGDETGGGGTRGKITGFSADSRRRLRSLVHSMRRESKALFMTLTWHEILPTPEEAKAALDRFRKRLTRLFPGASAIWKLEPQRRGTPHFHLFVYGVSWVDPQHISRLWHECTDEVSGAHRKSGVDVEWVREDGKVQAYLAKYFSKTEENAFEGPEWEWPGRFWGVIARKNLPVAAWAEWRRYLDPGKAAWLIRELLDEWESEIPDGVIPPTLTINTRGDPTGRLQSLLDRL